MPALPNPVTAVPAAPASQARAHFAALLAHETDCADVAAAMRREDPGFVLLDVRSAEAYAAGHIAGALNLPHGRIVARNLDALPAAEATDLFVVYCAGPHCNAADKAAVRLAELGRPVKKMMAGSPAGSTRASRWSGDPPSAPGCLPHDATVILRYTSCGEGAMSQRSSKVVAVSLPPELARDFEAIADAEGRNRSELFREMLRVYQAYREVGQFETLQRYGAAQARTIGIHSEEDVARLIAEVRGT